MTGTEHPDLRLVTVDDSDTLAALYAEDREFLRLWDPVRPESFFTPAGQRESLAKALDEHAAGRMWPAVIIAGDGQIVGRVSLNTILRGPFQSASLGYWVSRRAAGRGLATAAVAQCLEVAFGRLELHRVDAFAREENTGSCRVLEKNGFRRAGVSREHIFIDGRWRDDIFFQKLAPS